MCKEIDLMVAEEAFGNINLTLPEKFHGLDKEDLAIQLKKQYIGKQSYGVDDNTDLKILKRVMKMDILVFREHEEKYWYAFQATPSDIILDRPKTEEEKDHMIENFMNVLTVLQYGGIGHGGHFVCIQPRYHVGVPVEK